MDCDGRALVNGTRRKSAKYIIWVRLDDNDNGFTSNISKPALSPLPISEFVLFGTMYLSI